MIGFFFLVLFVGGGGDFFDEQVVWVGEFGVYFEDYWEYWW